MPARGAYQFALREEIHLSAAHTTSSSHEPSSVTSSVTSSVPWDKHSPELEARAAARDRERDYSERGARDHSGYAGGK